MTQQHRIRLKRMRRLRRLKRRKAQKLKAEVAGKKQ